METISIREILDQVIRGQIRIPAFQRGFVWEPDRVAYLMDSIYKQYPFGSLLFWRTKAQLRIEKNLGPFQLPEPKADYPVDYVLDGQQRLTSIFGVFQSDLEMDNSVVWQDIFFDLMADDSAQESQFVALAPDEMDPSRHFPLRCLFDTVAYRSATRVLPDDVATRVDQMQAVFKETRVPVQMSHTEDKATVAIIFERVNRQGVALDTLQLLSAWTWSEEFHLQREFEDLAEELAPFGFADLGEDTNLLLRCCSAILSRDASPNALMLLNGADVRKEFERVTNGVRCAIDYVRAHFKAERLSNLPFTTLVVPLAVFFAHPGNKEVKYSDKQRAQINRWFWRACFSRRYSSGVLRNLNADIEEMILLRDGKESSLGEFATQIAPAFFFDNAFGLGNVNTKTFILMLAMQNPRSFISGAPIDLATTLKDSNRTEFHHLMPRQFLRETEQFEIYDSALLNFCFMSRSDNRLLGGDAPSVYGQKMADNIDQILESALCPPSLFHDDFLEFSRDRGLMLTNAARKLCELPMVQDGEVFDIDEGNGLLRR